MSRPQTIETFTDYDWFNNFRLTEREASAALRANITRDILASAQPRLIVRTYEDDIRFESEFRLSSTGRGDSGNGFENYPIASLDAGQRRLISIMAIRNPDGSAISVNGKGFTPNAWLWVRALTITSSDATKLAVASVSKTIDYVSTSGNFSVEITIDETEGDTTHVAARRAHTGVEYVYATVTGTEFDVAYTVPNAEYELRIERRAVDGTVTSYSETRVWSPGPTAGPMRSFRQFSSEGAATSDVVRFHYDPPAGEAQTDLPTLVFYREEDVFNNQLNTFYVGLATDGPGVGSRSGTVWSPAEAIFYPSVTDWMADHGRGRYYMARLNETGSDGGQACDWVNHGVGEGRRSEINNIRFTEFYADRATLAWERSSAVESLRVRVNHAGSSTDYTPNANTLTVTGLRPGRTISVAFWVTAGGSERSSSEALLSGYTPPSLPPHAGPTDLAVSNIGSTDADFAWNIPISRGGVYPLLRHELLVQVNNVTLQTIVAGATDVAATLDTLTQNTNYRVLVRSVTTGGNSPAIAVALRTLSDVEAGFNRVRYLEFSQRDIQGINRDGLFRSNTFATPNRRIAIWREYTEGDEDKSAAVAFETRGPFTYIAARGSFIVEVVRAESSDVGDVTQIDPPTDSEYDILLALPQLFDRSVTTLPERKPQHYQIYVSAEVAALLENLGDEDDWPTEAVLAAENGLPDEPLNRDIVTLYRGGITSTRTWDGVLDQWVSFQGFIGGNLLVTGGIIADHIAANAIDADKLTARAVTAGKIDVNAVTADEVSFVIARGTKVRANTLEVLAVNVIGRLTASQINAAGITVNAINITGTIMSSQLDEKVRAPVTLYQKSTNTIGSTPTNHGVSNLYHDQAWQRGALTTFTNRNYDADELSTHFRHFLFEGWFRAWRPHGTIGVGDFDKYTSQLVPVDRCFGSVGALVTGGAGLEIGWRVTIDSSSATHPPVILWITPVDNTRPRIQMDMQSNSARGGQGAARFDLHRIAGVWKE